jgi:hypothetical protein
MSSREGVEGNAKVGGVSSAQNPTEMAARDIGRKYGFPLSEETKKRIQNLTEWIWNITSRNHKRYCDYPCFTDYDIAYYLILKSNVALWQRAFNDFKESFGNVSWNHFIHEITTFFYLEESVWDPIIWKGEL